MPKFTGRALPKSLLGLICVLAASLTVAQDRPVITAAASFSSATASALEGSSSRLPENATPASPIEPANPSPFIAVQPGAIVPVSPELRHRFWDRENTILFTAAAAAATADFFTTRANLASGGQELNPVTRIFTSSTPLLATNFGLETAGVIGISYMFHKTGHHKLERLTSFVDIGSSVGAVGYGLTHR
jgi:hypothetical protein